MVVLIPRWKYILDASAKALGAVLLQKHTAVKHFHPIVHYSKKFNNVQQNYSAIDHEILPTIEALWH